MTRKEFILTALAPVIGLFGFGRKLISKSWTHMLVMYKPAGDTELYVNGRKIDNAWSRKPGPGDTIYSYKNGQNTVGW